MGGCVRFLSADFVGRGLGGLLEPVEVCRYAVEFIGVEIAVDVRGDGGCGVAHGFLDVAKVGTGLSGQAGVGVAEVMDCQGRQLRFLQCLGPVSVAAPVV